jgi:uncharacterized protein
MKYGLPDETILKIQAIFSHYPQIEKAVLYGSRAKGTYKNGSDIDLTLMGGDIDISILYRVEEAIDELLLPYSFDLSLFAGIENANLIDHIRRVGIVFYERDIAKQ